MNGNENVFLTGATGLLGSYLLKILLQEKKKIFVLARSSYKTAAEKRVIESLLFWDHSISKRLLKKITIVEGDIGRENFGLTKRGMAFLGGQIEEIFHCAAATEFNAKLEHLREINVNGTERIFKLATNKAFKNIRQVNYISTAFVAGKIVGKFSEHDFGEKQKFNNNYERSKYEAEVIARRYAGDIKTLIFRPSIVAGDYRTGRSLDFKMFYEAVRLLSLELFDEIPINIATRLNLIPVDLAAEAIFVLSKAVSPPDNIFHIVAPSAFSITSVVEISSKYFHYKKPKFINIREYKHHNGVIGKKLLETYIPYFNLLVSFNSKMTQAVLRKYGFEYPAIDDLFLTKIFAYCIERNFLRIRKRER